MPSYSFKDPAPPEIPPLPLPDALPIVRPQLKGLNKTDQARLIGQLLAERALAKRSEEHTSELQSHLNLVCRLILLRTRRPPRSPLFPSPTLSRSCGRS